MEIVRSRDASQAASGALQARAAANAPFVVSKGDLEADVLAVERSLGLVPAVPDDAGREWTGLAFGAGLAGLIMAVALLAYALWPK